MNYNNYAEPRIKRSDKIFTFFSPILLFIVLLFLIIYTFHLRGLASAEVEPIIIEKISDEGVAKAQMIFELTGKEFPPEVAKWADITFSGSTVSIDTEKLNIWLGKNWESK